MFVVGAEDFVDTPGESVPPLVPPPTGTDMMGVTVFSEGPIGPYETVVLSASTAEEVMTWLGERGYQLPVQTLPLLEPYVTGGYRFVALRLSPQRVSSVLRPIILRSPAPAEGEVEACLPIRLTAVAAAPAMPIVAFFLGDALVAARNYSLAEPDLTSPALFRSAAGYQAAVASAADRLGGHSFAVDYAGRMPRLTVTLPSVLDLATATSARRFFAELIPRGYRGDQLLFDVLQRGLTPPAGMDATAYYNCLASSSLACGAPAHFDPAGLAAVIDREITQPRAIAETLLRRHIRLTRLSTELSPAEMTLDPVFVRGTGLPEVNNIHRGTLVRTCSNAYFREEAPVDLEVMGTRTPWAGGGTTTDAAYCGRFDALVSDGLIASGAAAEAATAAR